MSVHGDHDSSDHGDDHAHDPEPPEEVLADDEQPTPLWLTLLGGGLFVLATLIFVAMTQGKDADKKPDSAAVGSASAAAEPAPAPEP